ncbi:hypothetical protein LLOABG_LLOABG_11075, partial [Dysosmobacter welbionis]
CRPRPLPGRCCSAVPGPPPHALYPVRRSRTPPGPAAPEPQGPSASQRCRWHSRH